MIFNNDLRWNTKLKSKVYILVFYLCPSVTLAFIAIFFSNLGFSFNIFIVLNIKIEKKEHVKNISRLKTEKKTENI